MEVNVDFPIHLRKDRDRIHSILRERYSELN